MTNEGLKYVVLNTIAEAYADENSDLEGIGEVDLLQEFVTVVGNNYRIHLDEPWRIRIQSGSMMGYGYDFFELGPNGESAAETFETAVEATRRVSGDSQKGEGVGLERYISHKVIDNRYGVYVTSF